MVNCSPQGSFSKAQDNESNSCVPLICFASVSENKSYINITSTFGYMNLPALLELYTWLGKSRENVELLLCCKQLNHLNRKIAETPHQNEVQMTMIHESQVRDFIQWGRPEPRHVVSKADWAAQNAVLTGNQGSCDWVPVIYSFFFSSRAEILPGFFLFLCQQLEHRTQSDHCGGCLLECCVHSQPQCCIVLWFIIHFIVHLCQFWFSFDWVVS